MKLRTDGLTWREIDGETVLLDLNASTYLTTNATGTFLLKQLVEDRTMDELVEAVVAEYEVPRDRAQEDADAFVRTLQDKGLLSATAERPNERTS